MRWEPIGTFALASLATFAATQLRFVPGLSDYVSLLVALIFLGFALWRIGWQRPALERHGVALGGLLAPVEDDETSGPLGVFDLLRLLRDNAGSIVREIGVAIALAALLFPPFAIGFAYWHGVESTFSWQPDGDFAVFAVAQFVVVALPEEVFFRGYLQTALARNLGDDARGLPLRELDVRACILQALLFAIVHLAYDLNPARLAVFFPGLVFGMLRHWRGGVGAAIVFHALCNIYGEILFRGWIG